MTITTSINTVGVMRATEMLQSARTDAALDHREGPHTVSVEIARSSETGAQQREGRHLSPSSQRRVVDIEV